jgi:phage shock protein C
MKCSTPPLSTRQPGASRRRVCYRSTSDCVLSGVCGGIAEYLSIDPSLVRIAFVVATLWGGIGVLAYIVLAIVLPVSQQPPAPVSFSSERTRVAAGTGAGRPGWAPAGRKYGLGTLARLESLLARHPDCHRSSSVAAQPAR